MRSAAMEGMRGAVGLEDWGFALNLKALNPKTLKP